MSIAFRHLLSRQGSLANCCIRYQHPRAAIDPWVLSLKYTAIGPESNSRLQFDRFNFNYSVEPMTGFPKEEMLVHPALLWVMVQLPGKGPPSNSRQSSLAVFPEWTVPSMESRP